MFAQSLLDPNENAIAQAIYISQHDNKIKLPDEILNRPVTYEARARKYFADSVWAASMRESVRWLRDEPFDPRPAQLGSALSFDITLTAQAHEIASAGLACMPNNSILLNNRAVAAAYLGRLASAISDLNNAFKHSSERGYHFATLGLIAYRLGNSAWGARSYRNSINWYINNRDKEAAIRAYLYWLREVVRIKQTTGYEEISFAKRIIEKFSARDIFNEMNGLIEAIEREMGLDDNQSHQKESSTESLLDEIYNRSITWLPAGTDDDKFTLENAPTVDLLKTLSSGLGFIK